MGKPKQQRLEERKERLKAAQEKAKKPESPTNKMEIPPAPTSEELVQINRQLGEKQVELKKATKERDEIARKIESLADCNHYKERFNGSDSNHWNGLHAKKARVVAVIEQEIERLKDQADPRRVKHRLMEARFNVEVKKLSEKMDRYQITRLDYDAEVQRLEDEIAAVMGVPAPSVEKTNEYLAKIAANQQKLADAVESMRKIELIHKTLLEIKNVKTPYGDLYDAKFEFWPQYDQAKLAVRSIEHKIEKLQGLLNPQAELNARLVVYKIADEQKIPIRHALLQQSKAKKYLGAKIRIVRECVGYNCYLNAFGAPCGLRCYHVTPSGHIMTCDCIVDYYGFCMCRGESNCNHKTGYLILKGETRDLIDRGLVEFDDTCAYAQTIKAKQEGSFRNNIKGWLDTWRQEHPDIFIGNDHDDIHQE